MNNGVNENTNTNTNENTVPNLGAGVVFAPPSDGAVDASNSATSTSANSALNTQPVQSAQPVVEQPVQTQPMPEQPVQPQDPVVPPQEPVDPQPVQNNNPKPKKKLNLSLILLVLLIGLGAYTFYTTNSYKQQIATIKYECTPVTSSKEEVELDKESTLVKDLYSKVATNIREDLAESEFNDSMKLYLAYRQILEDEKYDSNCNLFNSQAMEPFKCEESLQFVPKAFKEDTLKQKVKVLFGEKTEIPMANIQLGNSCIGGYEYIEARGEFVQGYCSQDIATSFKVTKKLTKATSNRNTIILTEEVKYHENEKMTLPETLKSGIYKYTFRLDMNYNYVLISKTYEEKY